MSLVDAVQTGAIIGLMIASYSNTAAVGKVLDLTGMIIDRLTHSEADDE